MALTIQDIDAIQRIGREEDGTTHIALALLDALCDQARDAIWMRDALVKAEVPPTASLDVVGVEWSTQGDPYRDFIIPQRALHIEIRRDSKGPVLIVLTCPTPKRLQKLRVLVDGIE